MGKTPDGIGDITLLDTNIFKKEKIGLDIVPSITRPFEKANVLAPIQACAIISRNANRVGQELDSKTYKLGAKLNDKNVTEMDCADFSGAITNAFISELPSAAQKKFESAMYVIDPVTGKPVADGKVITLSAAQLKAQGLDEGYSQRQKYKTTQEQLDGFRAVGAQISNFGKSDPKQAADFPEGSYIYLASNKVDFAANRREKVSHVAIVVRGEDGQLYVRESNSRPDPNDPKRLTGVQFHPLQEWLDRYKDRQMFVVDGAGLASGQETRNEYASFGQYTLKKSVTVNGVTYNAGEKFTIGPDNRLADTNRDTDDTRNVKDAGDRNTNASITRGPRGEEWMNNRNMSGNVDGFFYVAFGADGKLLESTSKELVDFLKDPKNADYARLPDAKAAPKAPQPTVI